MLQGFLTTLTRIWQTGATGSSRHGWTQRAPRARRREQRPTLETLEPRELLTVTGVLNGTMLTIQGDNQNDAINITLDNYLQIASNGFVSAYAPGQVTSLVVNGGDGNDSITVTQTEVFPNLSISVLGQMGRDTLTVDNRVGTPVSLRANGGGANDVLVVSGNLIRLTQSSRSLFTSFERTDLGLIATTQTQLRDRAQHPEMATMFSGQVNAPLKSDSSHRSADRYRQVIDQFDVEYHARYQVENDNTKCNIFAGDVMRAMGVPIPTKNELPIPGEGSGEITIGARRLNAWLNDPKGGGAAGWIALDSNNLAHMNLLLEHVRAGKPAVASSAEHVAVIRPDQDSSSYYGTGYYQNGSYHINSQGLHHYTSGLSALKVSQAGALNMASGHFGDVGWDPSLPPQLFINVESTFVPGKTVSNLSGQRSQLQNVFRVTVPSISSPVVIQTSGGTGDADLVVYTATTWGQSFKYGSALQEVRQPGNVGQVVLTPGDEYYVMLRGFSNYSGVTLEARTIDVIPLSEGMEYTGLSGSYWSEKLFRIDVPAGMQQLSIQSQRGTGDADLFLRPGIAPTRDRFDHASQEATSNETITVQTPAAGAWYLLVHGYTAYSGVSLKASFIRQLDLRSLAARSDADYPDHVGNDYNGLGTSGAQDVGYAVLAPVGGEITYAGAYAPDDNGASAYGELLVAISKQVYRQDGLHNYREDGTYRLLGPGEVTVFVGHMTRERYLPSGEIDPLAPVINLTPGTYVSAGQVIGYVAPLSRAGSATQPHVHVGILPYRENGQGAAKFETATGRLTHFPGRWDLVDDRESPDSDFDSYAAYVRATLIAPPGSSRWDYLY